MLGFVPQPNLQERRSHSTQPPKADRIPLHLQTIALNPTDKSVRTTIRTHS